MFLAMELKCYPIVEDRPMLRLASLFLFSRVCINVDTHKGMPFGAGPISVIQRRRGRSLTSLQCLVGQQPPKYYKGYLDTPRRVPILYTSVNEGDWVQKLILLSIYFCLYRPPPAHNDAASRSRCGRGRPQRAARHRSETLRLGHDGDEN